MWLRQCGRVAASWPGSPVSQAERMRQQWKISVRLLPLGVIVMLVGLTLAQQRTLFDVGRFDRERVLKDANQYLAETPITITASTSPRSAGGVHDFFSEGDYWWPDPQNPDGPYIQLDGMSNPDNFVEHRRYLIRFSVQVPALAAAWKLTR